MEVTHFWAWEKSEVSSATAPPAELSLVLSLCVPNQWGFLGTLFALTVLKVQRRPARAKAMSGVRVLGAYQSLQS